MDTTLEQYMPALADNEALSHLRTNANLAYFEEQAAHEIQYKRKHWYYWQQITDYLNYFTHPANSVLEVGCGTGELLAGVQGNYKTGIDFSPAMIDIARLSYPELEFHAMAAENIDLVKKYDTIIISNLVGYLNDIEAVFEQLHKVSHPRTKVIVSYFNFLWQPLLQLSENLGLKRETPQQNWLSNTDLTNLLYLSGFDTYRLTRETLLPVHVPILSPILNKYVAKLPLLKHLCINMFAFAMPEQRTPRKIYSTQYSTSVVVPARNEAGNIESAVMRLPQLGKSTELIFVEGNSTDNTWQTIQEVQNKYQGIVDIKIAQQAGKGKGDAVRKGFSIATGDILMILDADLTVPPEDLPKFYNAIASGKGDFINGSRLVYKMDKNAMRPLNLLGNKFFSIVFSWLLDQPFKDTLCGTKVIFREDYLKLAQNRNFFGDFDPFGDFDLIFGAYKLNLKIVELPIRYRERTYGETNISRFKHGLILLQMVAYAARKIKFI